MKNERLLELCRMVCACDDALGQRSDHEGDEEGPTYRLFKKLSPKEFDKICVLTIQNHKVAVKVWRELQKLNSKRVKP